MDKNNWTYEEMLVCAGHIWAEKENEKDMDFLQDYDFGEMTNTIHKFLNIYSSKIDFRKHLENCFEMLKREENGLETTWTTEYFLNFT